MEQFEALNARIKAALPLDPASKQAQRFLDERDALLAPFVAAMPQKLKEATNSLLEKIRQGDLAPPIYAQVERFNREASQARRESGGA